MAVGGWPAHSGLPVGEGPVQRKCCAEEKRQGEMDRRMAHKRQDF